MAFEFKLPDVGEGIHEAVLVKWMVSEGDLIREDQAFVQVETDKAVVELPSPAAGTVQKLHFQPGELVHVGDVLISIAREGENIRVQPRPEKALKEPETESVKQPSGIGSGRSKSSRVLATPHTRALARKLGVDLAIVKPSGKGGRITDSDVETAAGASPEPSIRTLPELQQPIPINRTGPISEPSLQSTPESAGKADLAGEIQETAFGQVERVKISRLRQIIARNMAASKHTLAHVTHVDEADVTDLTALYRKVKQQVEESNGIRFTLMPFFVKAAVAAMKKFPVCNASFDEERQELILKKYFNVGFAADTPEGLVVPVIHHADRKDMIMIAAEIADKATRARERKLTLEELQGAGLTITNVGPTGGLFATPVIPLPQLAILGMHAIKERPVVRNGQIVIRKMMNLSITFDHRMIDGMTGALFLREVISLVENPEMLMLRLL